jgi:hypothetical protein
MSGSGAGKGARPVGAGGGLPSVAAWEQGRRGCGGGRGARPTRGGSGGTSRGPYRPADSAQPAAARDRRARGDVHGVRAADRTEGEGRGSPVGREHSAVRQY